MRTKLNNIFFTILLVIFALGIILLFALAIISLVIPLNPSPYSVKCAHVLAIGQNAAHNQWFMVIEIDKQPVSIFSDDPVMAYWSEKLDPYHPNFVNIEWRGDGSAPPRKFMTSMSLCANSQVPDSQ